MEQVNTVNYLEAFDEPTPKYLCVCFPVLGEAKRLVVARQPFHHSVSKEQFSDFPSLLSLLHIPPSSPLPLHCGTFGTPATRRNPSPPVFAAAASVLTNVTVQTFSVRPGKEAEGKKKKQKKTRKDKTTERMANEALSYGVSHRACLLLLLATTGEGWSSSPSERQVTSNRLAKDESICRGKQFHI